MSYQDCCDEPRLQFLAEDRWRCRACGKEVTVPEEPKKKAGRKRRSSPAGNEGLILECLEHLLRTAIFNRSLDEKEANELAQRVAEARK